MTTQSHLATRRVDESLLRQCARSGQMDSRQIAGHIKASELDMGCECALPIIVDDIRPVSIWSRLWAAIRG